MAGNKRGGRAGSDRGEEITETREALMRHGARLLSRHGLGVPVTLDSRVDSGTVATIRFARPEGES